MCNSRFIFRINVHKKFLNLKVSRFRSVEYHVPIFLRFDFILIGTSSIFNGIVNRSNTNKNIRFVSFKSIPIECRVYIEMLQT